MITHRTNADSLVLGANSPQYIWLQLEKNHAESCCRGHGSNVFPFDEFIYGHNDWLVYDGRLETGKNHRFANLIMVHKSRRDVYIPQDTLLLYDNYSSLISGESIAPLLFIRDGCDVGIGFEKMDDHIHVMLFYPLDAAGLHMGRYIEPQTLSQNDI